MGKANLSHQSSKPQRYAKAPQGYPTVNGCDAYFIEDDEGRVVYNWYQTEGTKPAGEWHARSHSNGIVRYFFWIGVLIAAFACVASYLS